MKRKIHKVGVLTSGGDAPGMNACIRAVVRYGIHHGLEIAGIRRGYAGLIDGDIFHMEFNSVSNIIQRGGTILRCARSPEFRTKKGMKKAFEMVQVNEIDALLLIGGDGTFRGAYEFYQLTGVPSIGVPATIDNDVYGTDFSVGYDTAINTALESIDKIRDSAESHERIFFVEVMGREAGFIALDVALASGAEGVLIPETKTSLNELYQRIRKGMAKGKTSSIIVVAEGDEVGGAIDVAKKFQKMGHMDTKVCVLGHIQRGGSPTAKDRSLASQLGAAAIKALAQGKVNKVVGEINERIVFTPISESWKKVKKLDKSLQDLVETLAI